MEHNYVRNDSFNMLTIKVDKKGVYSLSGETKEALAKGDIINYLVNEKFDVLEVANVTERRDSKDYPKGNGMFYRCDCKVVPNPNPPKRV